MYNYDNLMNILLYKILKQCTYCTYIKTISMILFHDYNTVKIQNLDEQFRKRINILRRLND